MGLGWESEPKLKLNYLFPFQKPLEMVRVSGHTGEIVRNSSWESSNILSHKDEMSSRTEKESAGTLDLDLSFYPGHFI